MESVQLNNVTDTSESEAEPINIEEESENSVTDIMNLDIKSRLSLATSDTYEEPRTNGMPRQGHFNEHEEAKTLSSETDDSNIQYVSYTSELQMPDIMHLIQKDLSEPYSIYTYRYFIHNWPKLCFLAMDGDKCIGAIVCKLDIHRKVIKRGYIAMLAVDVKYRKRKVGSNLVRRAIQAMMEDNADEVVLETEITNSPALRLYENLGFEHTEMGERRTKIICILERHEIRNVNAREITDCVRTIYLR